MLPNLAFWESDKTSQGLHESKRIRDKHAKLASLHIYAIK